MRERPTYTCTFAGWHNVELLAIRTAHQFRLFVSAGSSNWVRLTTNRLSLIAAPPVFVYYSCPAHDYGYGSSVNVIASSEFAVCTLMTLFHVVQSELFDTFPCDSRLHPGAPYLKALYTSVIKLVDAIGVCPIVDGTRIDMATSFIA